MYLRSENPLKLMYTPPKIKNNKSSGGATSDVMRADSKKPDIMQPYAPALMAVIVSMMPSCSHSHTPFAKPANTYIMLRNANASIKCFGIRQMIFDT